MKVLVGIQLITSGEQVLEEAIKEKERRDHVEEAKKAHAKNKQSRNNATVNRSKSDFADRNNDTRTNPERTVRLTATAYTAFCDTGCTGITATGLDVRNTIIHEGKRIIATDPNVIPLGTNVTLKLADGRQIEAVAEDTGGAIDGNRIDVLVGSRQEAINFGRQTVEAVIH
jgi:3D (Asp-Asp-Asp) domain-containing protein